MEQSVLDAWGSLVKKIKSNNKNADVKKITKAFETAYKYHDGQTRASGEPYILHPIAVTDILLELNMDTDSIVTAILHDTVEDTDLTFEDVEKLFGKTASKLVDGVTKLTKIECQPEHVKQAENFRKLLLAISEDIRVLLVKLADRIHNMRTLNYIKNKAKRMRIAHETMEIYAPLAERIGVHKYKNELQDMAFAELYPDIRNSIISRLMFLRKNGNSIINSITEEVTEKLKEHDIDAKVLGREKTSYSIWRKMEHKDIAFEQLSDILAFRIIVKDVQQCYHALGIINTTYHMIPGGFKDYISTPKGNDYRSLHTVVMGPEQRCIEIQIRTDDMNEVAELGVAAHWSYKQKTNYSTGGTQFRWVREMLEILENTSSPEEFLENSKMEMYYDQVFCFSPKGDLIALPKGGTPVDFAFAVHSKVGLTCVGSKVNGRVVPLDTKLANGDQVDIMRSKTMIPSPAWEKFVVTGKARAEIKKFIRSKRIEEYCNLGRVILEKTFQQHGYKFNPKKLPKLIKHFKKKSEQDFLAAVGEGIVPREEVLYIVYPELSSKQASKQFSLLNFKKKKSKKEAEPMPINGLIPGMAIHHAECCHPLPGDRIVGIVNTGKGITVHTSDCEVLHNFSSTPERWIDVSWEGTGNELYISRVKLTITNESGSLAAIAECTARMNTNIANIKVVGRSINFFELILDLQVKGLQQLNNLILSLRALNCVHSVSRN